MTPPTRCICQVSNWYLTTCTKKVWKTFRWLGALVTPPFKCFCPSEGQKLPNHDETRTWRVTPPTAWIYQVSNWYLKTCRKKARKTSKNPKRTKIIAKILKILFLQKTGLMSRSIQQATCVPNLKNLSWFMRPWLQKIGLTYFWL